MIEKLTVCEVEYMPKAKEPGFLYISQRFQLAIHMCPCGCPLQSVTPLDSPEGWTLTRSAAGEVTLHPSLLNPCGTHYFVEENRIRIV